MISSLPLSTVPISSLTIASSSIKAAGSIECICGRCIRVVCVKDDSCSVVSSIGCFSPKDPDDFLDYSIIWENWLHPSAEVTPDIIVQSNWFATLDSLQDLIFTNSLFEDKRTQVWISAGTEDEDYFITNRIHTDAGRRIDRTFKLKVKQL